MKRVVFVNIDSFKETLTEAIVSKYNTFVKQITDISDWDDEFITGYFVGIDNHRYFYKVNNHPRRFYDSLFIKMD